jgi:HK97 family phage portal protein
VKSLGGEIANAIKPAPQSEPPIPFARDGLNAMSVFGGSSRDRDSQLRAVEENSLLFSITNKTTTSLASVQWHLYEKTPAQAVTSDRVEVYSHAALDLLNKPNNFMTGYEIREAVQQHVDLTGEGYMVVARRPPFPIPLELWPVMPSRMEPVASSKKFLVGWMYTGPNGEQIPLRVDEVLRQKTPHPRDPYRGLGPVQSMMTQIDTYRFSEDWNKRFFENSAEPGGILQYDRTLQDEEFNQTVTRWNEQHRGVNRAHRVAIIENGQWITNQMSMVDMQFAELQTNGRDRMLEGFGMSGSMIGVTEDVNRANADAGKAMMAEYQTVPRAERWKQMYNFQLLPMYGDTTAGLEFDFDSPVPADQAMVNATLTASANAASVLITAGFVAEDVLQACSLPPMKWKAPPKPAAPVIMPPGGQPAPGEGDDGTGEPDGDEPPTNRRALCAPHPHLRNQLDLSQVDLTTVDEQWQAATSQVLAQYNSQALPAQQQQVRQQIEALIDAGELAALAALTISSTAAAAILLDAMVVFAHTASKQVANQALQQGVGGVTAQVPPMTELQVIAEVVTALMAAELGIAAGREAMRIWRDGMTGQQVADAVAEFLDTLSSAGPRMHLSGAMSAAQNKARLLAYMSGPACELYALEAMDTNTCAPCAGIDGQLIGITTDQGIQAKVDALYPNGGYVGCLGRERCRGTVLGVWSTKKGESDAG